MVGKPRKRSKKKTKKVSPKKSKKKVLKKRPQSKTKKRPLKKPRKKAVKKKTLKAGKKLVRKKALRTVKPSIGLAVTKPIQPFSISGTPLDNPIGVVTHYFSQLGVVVVRLQKGILKIGETIRIKGHTSDFKQKVRSMEIDHRVIESVVSGQEFGMKVVNYAREHDQVFRV